MHHRGGVEPGKGRGGIEWRVKSGHENLFVENSGKRFIFLKPQPNPLDSLLPISKYLLYLTFQSRLLRISQFLTGRLLYKYVSSPRALTFTLLGGGSFAFNYGGALLLTMGRCSVFNYGGSFAFNYGGGASSVFN